jgi:hypothetical protein
MEAMLAAAAVFCTPMTGGTPPAPEAVVDRFLDAYNRHDIGAVRKLVSADASFGMPGKAMTGEGTTKAYEEVVFVRWPTVNWRTKRRMIHGDLVAQIDVLSGLSGKPTEGLSVFRVDGGCIVELTASKEPEDE